MSGQVSDDNLVTRRKNITKGIEEIREKKAEIAKALRELGVSQQDENNSQENKGFIKQLIEAFDTLSNQETQYLDILKTIIGIHEQATLDIANDMEKKMIEEEKRLKEGGVEEQKQQNNEGENGEVSEDIAELQQALLELKTVSEAAIAASELNEKLVERLQMQKKKKSAMMEVRTKKAKDLDEEATRVRAEVMEKINKMSSVKKSTIDQTKELASLKKQCLELGLALDLTHEIGEDAHRDVADDQIRVPKTHAGNAENDEEAKEKRRQEIRENIAREIEEKEKVNTLIREKLAAMDARKKRLQQIRQLLEQQKMQEEQDKEQEKKEQKEEDRETAQPESAATLENVKIEQDEDVPPPLPTSPPPSEQQEERETSIDEILNNAKANLSNLTAMRERLEHIQSTGGNDMNEEDILMLQSLDQVVDIEETVRESFQDAISSRETPKNVGIEARLLSIEVTVADNRRILMEMQKEQQKKKIAKFCRLSTPEELRKFGEMLSKLAEMKENGNDEIEDISNNIHSILNDILIL